MAQILSSLSDLHLSFLRSSVSASQVSSQLFICFIIKIPWYAAYPEGHAETHLDEDTELEYLKEKVDAGGDFIITQLSYDVDRYLRWLKKVRQKGIRVPIIVGIMPIQTYSSFLRLVKLSGCQVPQHILDALARIRHDDQLVQDYGVKLAVEMIQQLTKEGDIQGFHFCTMNLETSVQRVLELLGWQGIGVSTMKHPSRNPPGNLSTRYPQTKRSSF
ncbi:hypothetical protein H0H81_000407 [Sphagnurus paluster]|uniref:Methylenetetrahydrofolate reductase (NAD(P)H) n=1 Tax=Sphagnurus paluster TaxID=117069 RepID=A0A9P7K3G2_9AGAR|nr:hypothetical protein H0H81_000407 [Sphagnurus paluster]